MDPLVEMDLALPIDWTFLAGINLLQVAVVIVAMWVIFRLLIRFWPWLRKVMNFTAALAKLPDFMVRVDKTLGGQNGKIAEIYDSITDQNTKIAEIHDSITDQDGKIAEIHHETSYNNETSMKDALRRVELGVKGLYDQLGVTDGKK